MDIKSFAQNIEFLRLADTYTPIIDENNRHISHDAFYHRKISNMEQAEFLVPILGVQGAGKSSMLNALLMDELVLPVDADETTCIPVEIRYSRESEGKYIVHFQDGRKPETITTTTELEQFVHNSYSAGNAKGVSHIVVYKDNPVLASGLVLVDLPGVGSLTLENVQTTMRYIERLAAAIFLLRTVPPITRTERIFLRAVWPKLTTAWFVQNQWDDESDSEVTEGKEHNANVLRSLATQHKTTGDLEVMVVNVYQALRGRLEKNESVLNDSGILNLWSKIRTMADNWQILLKQGFCESLQTKLTEIRAVLSVRQEELALSDKELRQRHQIVEQAYEEKVAANKEHIDAIEVKVSEYRQTLRKYALSESTKLMESLRGEMRRVIGSGIVDGQLLNRAYQDNYRAVREDLAEKLSQKLFEIQQDLAVDLDNLEVKNIQGSFTKYGEFLKVEKTKYEKGLPVVGSIIGGLLGGPAGWLVGAGAVILGGWLGKKAKNYVGNRRQKSTIRDLEEPLQQFRRDAEEYIKAQASCILGEIEKCLLDFGRTQQLELAKLRQDNEKSRAEQESDFGGKEERLQKDFAVLTRLEAEVPC